MKLSIVLHERLQKAWQHKGLLSTLLWPLSVLAGVIIEGKHKRYLNHPGRIYRSALPVVVVGNIYVGGTGKTPVVIALTQALQALGWTPGVISRGYGADIGTQPRTGLGQVKAAHFGDEPALITAATQAPIAVHPDRPLALRALQAAYPHVNVIISDDGLQHLALGRDIEIIVQDARGTGNGRLLPAGPLREPARRLLDVDTVITNLAPGESAPATLRTQASQVSMTLRPTHVEHLQTGQVLDWTDWLAQFGDTSVSALAAIGRPERFFTMLKQSGVQLASSHALPDHDAYLGSSPFCEIKSSQILITAKDAVKCRRFQDQRLWIVHATPVFSDPAWTRRISDTLRRIARPAPRH